MLFTSLNVSLAYSLHQYFSASLPLQYLSILLSDGMLLITACAYVLVILPLRRRGKYHRTLFLDIAPAIVTIATGELWKMLFPVARPFAALKFEPIVRILDPLGSFPSLHVAFLAAFATTMIYHNRKLGIALFSMLPLLMLGRMAVGAHWLNDVIVGAIFGAAVAYLLEYVRRKRQTAG